VPIYVLPPAVAATAPIVFLAPTFTYQIYGNHQRGNVDDAFIRLHALRHVVGGRRGVRPAPSGRLGSVTVA
jgi:hypothetical protein